MQWEAAAGLSLRNHDDDDDDGMGGRRRSRGGVCLLGVTVRRCVFPTVHRGHCWPIDGVLAYINCAPE
jgi:hypothetical protein